MTSAGGGEQGREPTTAGPACTGCGRTLECCCFCDREGCEHAVCSACVRVSLREALPALHTHGG